MAVAKRKTTEEHRKFQSDWTETYAFIESHGALLCLICTERIASFKKSNVKRHFETHHAAFAAKYPVGESRKKACAELQRKLHVGQQQMQTWTDTTGSTNAASFAAALGIVRHGKPFTDGEYVKSCMLNMATELFADFPNKEKIIQKIKDVPLSARTVHDRAVMMAHEIEGVQIQDITSADFFSLALDESTDTSNIAQLNIVGRYVSGDTMREEYLCSLPMNSTTKGEDVLTVFMNFADEKKLPLDKLVSVCTDGAPNMVGKRKGFVSLLCEKEKRCILSYHCALHQEALCAKSCGPELREVMSLVIKVVNFIVARALNERQFKELLQETGNNYSSLLLHNNVRWLSRGKVLARFAACLDEVKAFLEKKGAVHPELTDQHWLCKFYYLVDLTEHLNQLNTRMQGHGNTVLSLCQAVLAFESKLELFINDIESGRLMHFDTLRAFRENQHANEPTCEIELSQLTAFTSDLLMSFKARFVDFRAHRNLFRFITHPHETTLNDDQLSIIPGTSIANFELEMADLKSSDIWLCKFVTLNANLENVICQRELLAKQHKWNDMGKLQREDTLILKTWNELPPNFETMRRVSTAVLTMFGSTYSCEQSFSHMNNIKSNQRSRLTCESLNACMKLNLTTYEPDYKAISKTMQSQKSH